MEEFKHNKVIVCEANKSCGAASDLSDEQVFLSVRFPVVTGKPHLHS